MHIRVVLRAWVEWIINCPGFVLRLRSGQIKIHPSTTLRILLSCFDYFGAGFFLDPGPERSRRTGI